MKKERSKTLWVSTLYFAEGLPLMLIRYLGGVYLTDIGVRERYLGLLNLLGIPWNIKFLWAPFVDIFSTKRTWLLVMEAGIGVLSLVLAALASIGPPSIHQINTVVFTPQQDFIIGLFVVALTVGAFIAATHDIAIDGFYMDAIEDPKEQAAYTGLRVMTYRLAVIFAKSILVGLAAWLSWTGSFIGAALTMLGLVIFHMWYLPKPPKIISEKSNLTMYIQAFSTYIRQPKAVWILLFVATYKLGDELLFSMNTPFLMRYLHITKAQLSWLSGIVGTVFSIAGSLISAWSIKRFGLKKAIWPLTLSMNINIVAYIFLALLRPDPTTTTGIAIAASVHAYEQFASGLGNAVLIVYIMRTCLPEFKSAHYAIASAIASVGGVVLGSLSGTIVEAWGYIGLFELSVAATIPSMVILYFIGVPEEQQSTG